MHFVAIQMLAKLNLKAIIFKQEKVILRVDYYCLNDNFIY